MHGLPELLELSVTYREITLDRFAMFSRYLRIPVAVFVDTFNSIETRLGWLLYLRKHGIHVVRSDGRIP